MLRRQNIDTLWVHKSLTLHSDTLCMINVHFTFLVLRNFSLLHAFIQVKCRWMQQKVDFIVTKVFWCSDDRGCHHLFSSLLRATVESSNLPGILELILQTLKRATFIIISWQLTSLLLPCSLTQVFLCCSSHSFIFTSFFPNFQWLPTGYLFFFWEKF